MIKKSEARTGAGGGIRRIVLRISGGPTGRSSIGGESVRAVLVGLFSSLGLGLSGTSSCSSPPAVLGGAVVAIGVARVQKL